MSARRYIGGERVVISDIGARVDPEGASIAEFDGEVGTVAGYWSGFVAVSLDNGPEVLVRPSEVVDYVEPAPAVEPEPAEVEPAAPQQEK